MNYQLKEKESKILYEILKRYKKLNLVINTNNKIMIPYKNFEEVMEFLGDYIAEYGISNDEINREGKMVDDLITVLLKNKNLKSDNKIES
ncbi:hypothetical protein [Sulfurimonas sp. CS5]|jgi:hypothetical protein|uniref:hypothetical protein n=1 Tax=Sulfurimonas sp. CS5 TaxID=3391145 RepID=UPI0039E78857